MCKITVFTPTYNRGYIIGNLYESLVKQSFKDFEWLIIDQGNDDTGEKVKNYISENKIKTIRYFKTPERKGINRSMNDAIRLANGKLMFKVDDDDYLTEDALQNIDIWEKELPKYSEIKYAGVSGLRAYHGGKIIGGEWKHNKDYIDATGLERRKYFLLGDKAEAYYTSVFRKYGPLPEFEGETLTFESILYDKIAYAGYKIRWFNHVIYYTEYLPDGQTINTRKKLEDNLKTYGTLLNTNLQYKSQPLKHVIKNLCRYSEMCRRKNIDYHEACDIFKYNRILVRLCWGLSNFTKRIKPRGERQYNEQ